MLISQLQPHYNANQLSNIKGRINNYVHKATFKKLLRRNTSLTQTRSIQDLRINSMSESSKHHAMVAALCTPSPRGFLAQKIMLKHTTPFLFWFFRVCIQKHGATCSQQNARNRKSQTQEGLSNSQIAVACNFQTIICALRCS